MENEHVPRILRIMVASGQPTEHTVSKKQKQTKRGVKKHNLLAILNGLIKGRGGVSKSSFHTFF